MGFFEHNPRVSLCVPTYNRARMLGETIESALEQSFTDFELVIVDDLSPDDTGAVVERYRDPRIRYIRNDVNRGVPENLNRALELGTGEYLVLLEDHDLLDETYLEKTVALLDANPSVGFVATGLTTIDESGVPLERYQESFPAVTPGTVMLRRLLRRTDCPFSVTTTMRRSVLKRLHPWFDSAYWWYADQHLWLRMLAEADFGYIREPLLQFRTREADHYLTDKVWETLLAVDRVHNDDWHLLHPAPSWRSLRDRMAYTSAKFVTVAGIASGKRLRNEPWTGSDIDGLRRYLPRIPRAAIMASRFVPPTLFAIAKRVWERRRAGIRVTPRGIPHVLERG